MKKEREKYERFAQEEEERRRIDAEEQAINEAKKKEAIEKANKMVWD